MKTFDEFKKGLKVCAEGEASDCGECPYDIGSTACVRDLLSDAIFFINDMEESHRTEYCDQADYDCVELGKARKRIAELEAERLELLDIIDGVSDNICDVCKHSGRKEDAGICAACVDAGSRECFEWRGKA